MAENVRNLVIKVDTDVAGVGKGFKVVLEALNDVEKGSKKTVTALDAAFEVQKRMEAADKVAIELKKELAQAFIKLSGTIDKLNLSEKLSEAFKLSAGNAAVNAFNTKVATITPELVKATAQAEKLKAELNSISPRSLSIAGSAAAITNPNQSGITAAAQQQSIDNRKRIADEEIRVEKAKQAMLANLAASGNALLAQNNRNARDRDEALFAQSVARHMEITRQGEAQRLSTIQVTAALARRARQAELEATFADLQASLNRQENLLRRYAQQETALRNRNRTQATTVVDQYANATSQVRAQVALESAIRDNGARSDAARRAQHALDSFNIERRYIEQLANIRAQANTGKLGAAQANTLGTAALTQYANAVRGLPSLNEHIREHTNLFLRIGEIIGAYRILNSIFNTISNSIRAVPHIGIELDSTKASLLATVGSAAGAASALEALDKEAARTGITITTLRESFRGFEASTSLAGASLESTWKMFTNMDTVITGLHLSADKANGIFLAMAQIFNKGKLQSEELVKQLGNLLPGAFASMAASMHILPSELSKQMKLGMVRAQDVMEDFTTYMANRFAPAFALASQGFNAQVGKMQTSFTHLGETIYEVTSSKMIKTVKVITSIADSLTALINGTEKLSQGMSVTLKAALGVATVAFVGLAIEIASSTAAVNLLLGTVALFNTLAVAVTAVGGAFYYLYQQAHRAETAIAEAGASERDYQQMLADTKALKDKNTSVSPLEIKIEKDDAVVKAKEKVDAAKTQLAKEQAVKDSGEFISNGMRNAADSNLEIAKKGLKHWEAYYKERQDLARKDIEAEEVLAKDRQRTAMSIVFDDAKALSIEAIEKHPRTSQEAGEKAADKTTRQLKKLRQSATEVIESQYLKDTQARQDPAKVEEAKEVFRNTEEAIARSREDAVKAFNAKMEAEAKKGNAGVAKEITAANKLRKEGYAEENYARNENQRQNDIDAIKNEERYKRNEISIQEYFGKKRQFIEEDNRYAIAAAQRNVESARAGGQNGEEIKAVEALAKAKHAVAMEQAKNDIAQKEALTGLTNQYKVAEITYLEAVGKIAEANKLRQEVDPNIKKFKAEDTPESNKAAEHLVKAQKIKEIEGDLGILRQERNISDNKYAQELQRIDILERAGSLSKLSGMFRIDTLTKEHIKDLEKTIAAEDKLISQVTEDANKSSAIEKIKKESQSARNELEKLKAEGSTIANYFENIVGGSFENAFASVVTGSATAAQAFNSFSISVQGEIAKIVAAEIKSAIIGSIIKPLIGLGMNALSGVSGLSGPGGYSGVPLQSAANANALGNVHYGPSISAYSGTIVDKPTFFAKGGNVMGEAGPEAILPLTRDKSGKLGVRSTNNLTSEGSSGIIIQNLSVTVQEKEGSTSEEQAKEIGIAIKDQLKTLIDSRLVNATRSGGTLNPTSLAAQF
jgi:tape measure domain-containing protein